MQYSEARPAIESSSTVFQPRKGLCLIMLGPDGVGKSTMKAQLLTRLAPIFPNYRTYHFRPRIIGRIGPGRPISKPHSMKPRGRIASVAYLLTVFTDYWLGYIFRIRPLLKRCSLVVLDRYFHDLLIDPIRYRYGAPMWLARGLRWLIPPRDVFFLVLDADENIIYSRKQELPFHEVVRQRKAYVTWAAEHPNSLLVRTDCSAEKCAAEAAQGILDYLARRAGDHADQVTDSLEREAIAKSS